MVNKKTGPKVEGLADDDPTPALFIHCQSTYRAMAAEAREVTEGETSMIIWEGMFTAFIVKKLNLSVPYYTQITRALKRMGCIRQIKRGGGSAPSMWELITEPTEELYRNKMPRRKAPRTDRVGMLQDQFDTLNQRVSVLERAFENIIAEDTK